MTVRDLRPSQGLLMLIGVAIGASAAASGMFETAVWRPVALGVFAVALALVIGARARPGSLALAAIAGLSLLAGWAWLSIRWAESTSRAETMASRWTLHAALLVVFVLVLHDRRARLAGLAAVALPALGVAGWALVRLLAGTGPGLFVGGQLTSPLGYSNADATYFLLAAWPLVAAAESRRIPVSAVAVAGLTALGGLIALTQARGAAVAFAVAAIVIVAVAPGRMRRIWVLLAAGGGVALLAVPLDVLQPTITTTGVPRDSTLRDAGLAILGVAVGAGLLWFAVGAAAARLAQRSAGHEKRVGRASVIALAAVGVVAVAGLGIASGRISDRLSNEYHDFVDLKSSSASSPALLGGGPNQHDYWRVALNEFREAPLKGIGAGDYQRDYFRERRTNEDVRQPHSVVFQTLAELGLVGILGLALFAVGVLAGLWRVARRARASTADLRVAVGAGGAFVAWLAHSAIDWTWLFPSLFGMALLAAALLVAGSEGDMPRRGAPDEPAASTPPTAPDGPGARRFAGTAPLRAATIAVVAACLVAASLATARQIATQHYRAEAQAALGANPVRTLQRTSKALALHDEDVGTRYLRAAAFARLDDFDAARGQLNQALRLEPHAWVTWALLGDVELRHGAIGRARDAYKRALALNPRDQGLAQAATNPGALARTMGLGVVQGG
jgi:O-antigen ligase/polysaccharide polymerase Wzy-like membrane protein